MFNPPLLGRAGFEQKVIDKNPLVVNDDVVSLCPLWSRDRQQVITGPDKQRLRSPSTPKVAPNGTACATLPTSRTRSSIMGNNESVYKSKRLSDEDTAES